MKTSNGVLFKRLWCLLILLSCVSAFAPVGRRVGVGRDNTFVHIGGGRRRADALRPSLTFFPGASDEQQQQEHNYYEKVPEESSSSEDQQQEPSSSRRRHFLNQSIGAIPALAFATKKASAVSTTATTAAPAVALVADLPMIRLKLPRGAVGREYVAIQLMIDGKGPFDFMVDSGLTTELITPHLAQSLGLRGGKYGKMQGLAAGGSTTSQDVIELKGAALCCGKFADPATKAVALPPLLAVVTDFPQEHIDPAHDPVEGMLGMEMLTLFDVDFDFPRGRLRLWAPGTAAAEASKAGLVEVPTAVINETLLLGMRVTSPQAGPQPQPILGILDCGSSFSAVNWDAAPLLGLPSKQNADAYRGSLAIQALGVDGRPLTLPMKKLQFSFTGNVDPKTGTFAKPPASFKPWNPVSVGVGDLPVFSTVLGDGKTPFKGPAALIGLDVLSQRRVILETAKSGRRRRLFVSPS